MSCHARTPDPGDRVSRHPHCPSLSAQLEEEKKESLMSFVSRNDIPFSVGVCHLPKHVGEALAGREKAMRTPPAGGGTCVLYAIRD